MNIYKKVTCILIGLLIVAVCKADDGFDQSVLDELQTRYAIQPCEMECCEPECKYMLQSLDGGSEVILKRLKLDVNSDGESDFILSSKVFCGASNCIEAILVGDRGRLKKVFEGQNIAYLPQSTKGFRDLVQGLRGEGQVNYGIPGKLPLYQWNGNAYVETGLIDIGNTNLTRIDQGTTVKFSGPDTVQIPQDIKIIEGTNTANSTPNKEHTEPASANVCGSDVSKYLVPDFVCFDDKGGREPYHNCAPNNPSGYTLVGPRVDFTAACTKHDVCYGNKGASKSNCDASFYEDLKQACRSQVGGAGADRVIRACIDTALQFNDVVRGQATRRFGLWMEQVPFTGQSSCDAYVAAQSRAGVTDPSCTTAAPP